MKKLSILLILALVLSFSVVGCKTTTGDKIAATTGIGDGTVSFAESRVLKIAESKILPPRSAEVLTGLHIISAGLLEKMGDDPTSLTILEDQLQEVIAEYGITSEDVLKAVDELTGELKLGLYAQIGEADDSTYLVGIKAVIVEVCAQTKD
jgi:hypothetical protein